jgi:predicted nucleic acid-binding protein
VIFYYLDASAWVKRYYQETGTAWVQELFARNPALACAALGLVEVMATLARKKKAGEIAVAGFAQKTQELEADWEDFIQVQTTAEVTERAKTLAKEMALRGADAVHLASALILQDRFTEEDSLIFVTSDKELKEAAQQSGLTTIDPHEREQEIALQEEEAQPGEE